MESSPLTTEQLAQVDRALWEGRHIEAIKIYRGFVGCELVDAKQFVDQRFKELKRQNPTHFQRQPSGCLNLVFVVLIFMFLLFSIENFSFGQLAQLLWGNSLRGLTD